MYFETGKYYNYIVTEVIYINEEAKERIRKSIELESKTNYMDEPNELY